MSSRETFLKSFSEVFDDNDDITCCGREKCKALIDSAISFVDDNIYLGIPRERIGDCKTGRLNKNIIIYIRDFALSSER